MFSERQLVISRVEDLGTGIPAGQKTLVGFHYSSLSGLVLALTFHYKYLFFSFATAVYVCYLGQYLLW